MVWKDSTIGGDKMADIHRVQDPKISQKELVSEYKTTFENGQVDNAHNLIDNDAKESITLNSKKINPLLPILTTLQQNYTTNVTDDLASKQAQFQAWIDALQSNLTPWVANTAYHAYTPVFDSSTSESYLAIQDVPNTGILLSNTSYWLPLMIKGDDGYVTWGVTYKGPWTSGANYQKYDMVSYGALVGGTTKMFCATETITNSTTPPSSSSSTAPKYTTSTGVDAIYGADDGNFAGTITMARYGSTLRRIDFGDLLTEDMITSAPVGTQWRFKIIVPSVITEVPIENTNYFYGGSTAVRTMSIEDKYSRSITLDFNNNTTYILTVTAGGTIASFYWEYFQAGYIPVDTGWQEVLDITRAEINIYQGDLPNINNLYSRQIFINLPTSGTPATFYRVVGGLNEYITSIGGTATITNDDSESLGTIDATLPVAGSGTYAMRVDASSLISQADWNAAAGGTPFTIKVFVDSEQFNPPLSGSVQLVYGDQNASNGFTNMPIRNHNQDPISLDYTNYYYLFTFSKNAGGGAAISNTFVTYFSDDAAPKELAKLNIYTTINQVSMPQLDGTNGFANQTISGVRGGFNNLRNYFNILELP